jgi:hypothetical protein
VYSDTKDNITSIEPSAYRRDREAYFREARAIQPTESVICGHFPIRKYAHVAAAARAAIIRHPVDRLISHYFWLKATASDENPMWPVIRDNRLTILDVAQMPNMRWFYSEFYFHDASPGDFDLVMFAEHFDEGLARLSELVGQPLHAHRVNVTEGNPALMARARERRNDPQLRSALERVLADDVALYEAVRRWPTAARSG